MHEDVFLLNTGEGLSLEGMRWKPGAHALRVVVLAHGLGEHGGRYGHVAERFTAGGNVVYACDLRGHGKSMGARGHAASMEQLLDDLAIVIRRAASENPGIPLFLYGHSLGGNIVTNYLLRKDISGIKGAVITSPWFRLAFEPPAIKILLGYLMKSIFPAFSQPNGVNPDDLSKDPQVAKAYREDPLVHDRISAGLFFATREAGLYALSMASSLKIPALLMHGSDDRLTSAESTKEFAEKSGKQATFKLWNGLKHELHNEVEKKEVLDFVIRWIGEVT